MMNWKLSTRLIVHIFGAILIAFGVQTIVYSNIGAAPLDATVFYITRLALQLFAGSNFDRLSSLMGVASLFYGTIITLVLIAIKPSKKIIITWLNILLVALFIFLWGFLFDVLPSIIDSKYVYRVLIGITGLLPLSVGVFATLISGIPAGPHEELQRYFETKVSNVFTARLIVEISYLLLAFLLMIISVVVIDKNKLDFSQVGWFSLVVSLLTSVLIYLYTIIFEKIKIKFEKGEYEVES